MAGFTESQIYPLYAFQALNKILLSHNQTINQFAPPPSVRLILHEHKDELKQLAVEVNGTDKRMVNEHYRWLPGYHIECEIERVINSRNLDKLINKLGLQHVGTSKRYLYCMSDGEPTISDKDYLVITQDIPSKLLSNPNISYEQTEELYRLAVAGTYYRGLDSNNLIVADDGKVYIKDTVDLTQSSWSEIIQHKIDWLLYGNNTKIFPTGTRTAVAFVPDCGPNHILTQFKITDTTQEIQFTEAAAKFLRSKIAYAATTRKIILYLSALTSTLAITKCATQIIKQQWSHIAEKITITITCLVLIASKLRHRQQYASDNIILKQFAPPNDIKAILNAHTEELQKMLAQYNSQWELHQYDTRGLFISQKPWLPGYYIKYGIERAINAEGLRRILKRQGLSERVGVPDKYVYRVPGTREPLSSKNCLIIVRKIQELPNNYVTMQESNFMEYTGSMTGHFNLHSTNNYVKTITTQGEVIFWIINTDKFVMPCELIE